MLPSICVKVSIPQAVGTVATKKKFVAFIVGLVSIPQAVGTVATFPYFIFRHFFMGVSIPQAVGTVATDNIWKESVESFIECFNTASGRYCCNVDENKFVVRVAGAVSIPQAVGTVATEVVACVAFMTCRFQYRKR